LYSFKNPPDWSRSPRAVAEAYRHEAIGLVIKDVVGKLVFAARYQLAPDDDPSLREMNLLTNLGQKIPACLVDGGCDEFVQMSRSLRLFLFTIPIA
jgi:hypothetical protein